MAATPSGSLAFFTSCEKLTDDSTAVSTEADHCEGNLEGQDLYAYDAASGELSDLTVDHLDPLGAAVQGVLGTSEDGSHVYFVANGDLDGGGPAQAGNCTPQASTSVSGQCNLYLAYQGKTTFIARLDLTVAGSSLFEFADALNWLPIGDKALYSRTARVSADGSVLLFSSQRRLTAYDSEGAKELYRYQADSGQLTCISCDPSGAPPLGDAKLMSTDTRAADSFLVPGAYQRTALGQNLSPDGRRIFFETPDKLVAGDLNGEAGCPEGAYHVFRCQDVYEWEAYGKGSCTTPGGCLYLISSGTSPDPSYFAGASTDGDRAFFFTRAQLVPQDADEAQDVYMAGVGDGLASQHAVPPPPCEGEACRGKPSEKPSIAGAGSEAFEGPGNSQLRGCSAPAARLVRRARRLHGYSANARRRAARLRHAAKRDGQAAKRARHAAKRARRAAKRARHAVVRCRSANRRTQR